jgi:hypothetical protein
MSIFFFFFLQNQRRGTSPVSDVGASVRSEQVGKGCERMNMVQKLPVSLSCFIHWNSRDLI